MKAQQKQSGYLDRSAVSFCFSGVHELIEGAFGDVLAGYLGKIEFQCPNPVVDLGVLGKQADQGDSLADYPVPDVILVIHGGLGEEPFLVDQVLREMAGKVQRAFQRSLVQSLPAILLDQAGADQVLHFCNEEIEIELEDRV